ncbi:hypothetical protein LCGC14_0485640 [marine sediment metagenome]|uniref:Uncharacterized protein n=1 Tax=marine sediment metagenome TaxID=412755 RepID=A0A0F9SR75_9ZZZZ
MGKRRTFRPASPYSDVPGLGRDLERVADLFLRPSAFRRTPSSATDKGNPGDWAYDASYIYICVDTDIWKRVAISTW